MICSNTDLYAGQLEKVRCGLSPESFEQVFYFAACISHYYTCISLRGSKVHYTTGKITAFAVHKFIGLYS